MNAFRSLALICLLSCQDPIGGQPPVDLHLLVQSGDLDKVKEFLAKNPKLVNDKGRYGETPLQIAATQGSVAVAELLLAAGAELDLVSAAALGKTAQVAAILKEKPWLAKPPHKPLHPAAGHGHLEIVKLLLENGADPNLDYGFHNIRGPFTPLSNAVGGGYFEIAKLLCEHGAKANVSGGKNHDSLFHYAVGYRDARFVKLMLEYGADPDAVDHWGLTPLHVTAVRGSIDKAKLLLDKKADINAQTADGATPLFFAAVHDHRAYGDFLLTRGAKLDIHSACAFGKTVSAAALLKADPSLAKTRDKRLQRTPLFWAARSGDRNLVELLLALGAEVTIHAPAYTEAGNVITGPQVYRGDQSADAGPTPLHLAAEAGHLDIARLLLDKGTDVNAKGEFGTTPLHMACDKHHADVVKLLLGKGADVQAKTSWGNTPLHEALEDKACVEILLRAKADINAFGMEGTPLLAAAYHDYTQVVELLLANGAKLDLHTASLLGKAEEVKKLLKAMPQSVNAPLPQQNYLQETPLMLAARNGHVNVVELLVAQGAAYDPVKLERQSPLGIAAMHGQVKVVAWFLSHGVPVDARHDEEATALCDACMFNQLETVRLLLDKKADPRLKIAFWGSALHIVGRALTAWGPQATRPPRRDAAQVRREVEIARLLIEGGANVQAMNLYGETPLHGAAERGQAELAAFLISNGANVNARDHYGRTPLAFALRPSGDRARLDTTALAELLRKHGGRE